MSSHKNHIAARACVLVSAVHCGVDIGQTVPDVAVYLDLVPGLDWVLLCGATVALILHLVLERGLFDYSIAGAHGSNLLVGWIVNVRAWVSIPAVVVSTVYWPVGPLALTCASIATMIEVCGLREAHRRLIFIGMFVLFAVCVAAGKAGGESNILLPREPLSKGYVAGPLS